MKRIMNDEQRHALDILTLAVTAFYVGYALGCKVTDAAWIKQWKLYQEGMRRGLTQLAESRYHRRKK